MGLLAWLKRLFRLERRVERKINVVELTDEFEVREICREHPLRVRRAGSEALRKVSDKYFKPRPAFEKRLWKPDAKPDED